VYPAFLSHKAKRQLEALGVQVRTNSLVTHMDESSVSIGEERVATKTVLWAAGVQASPLGKMLGVPVDRAGRVKVEPDLSVPGHPEIFVIGDLALFPQDGGAVPGVAPAAIQEGRHVAENIERTLKKHTRLAFHYRDKGSLATIGRASAVGDLKRLQLSGLVAWLAWMLIHIVYLIGFRNRLVVLFDWAYSYLTYERGARLITSDGECPEATKSGDPANR
jgi:NADH:ubiquinone reductase (H+-translocating)